MGVERVAGWLLRLTWSVWTGSCSCVAIGLRYATAVWLFHNRMRRHNKQRNKLPSASTVATSQDLRAAKRTYAPGVYMRTRGIYQWCNGADRWPYDVIVSTATSVQASVWKIETQHIDNRLWLYYLYYL